MDRKVVALTVVAVLIVLSSTYVLSMDRNVSWQQLEDSNPYAAAVAESYAASDSVTVQDILNFTLIDSGVPESQLGNYPSDWNSMSVSCGLTDGIRKDLSALATERDLTAVIGNSATLRNTFAGGVTAPMFVNGIAQPVFPYTYDGADGYSNSDSQILRYCVYVETEYDTDNDGSRDLLKVYIQVPRAAVEGGYKAPVVMMCNPYALGTNQGTSIMPENAYDLSILDSRPDARVPAGEMTAMDAINDAETSDWMNYSSKNCYDYLLVRGYAFAICAGLGSAGSDGFQMCGTETELRSYASVIGWFNGTVPAYTDTDNLMTTAATWCSGDVGAFGLSYVGTIAVGLAAMGVDGLRTVIPEGAISDWYEYSYHQGAYRMVTKPYNPNLAWFCSSGWEATEEYINYLNTLAYYENLLEYHYSDGLNTFWEDRDYSRYEWRSDTSVLLFHGLNDFNVKTQQAWDNYRLFLGSGTDVKMILHQGSHQSQVNYKTDYSNLSMTVCGMDACSLYNMWFSCYLFGQDNGVKDMPNISVQDNTDGSWISFDNLDCSEVKSFVNGSHGTNTFSKKGYDSNPTFSTESDSGRTAWTVFTADEDVTISGNVTLSLTASATKDSGNLYMTVYLYDVCEDGFLAYDIIENKTSVKTEVVGNRVKDGGDGVWSGSNLTNYDRYEFVMTEVTKRMITNGAVNLCMPDAYDTRESWSIWSDTEAGAYYDYKVRLYPTVYTLEKGHSLVAVIYAVDADIEQYKGIVGEDYEITVVLESISLEMPVL